MIDNLVDVSESGSPKLNRTVDSRMNSFLNLGGGREKVDIKTAQKLKEGLGKRLEKANVWTKLKRGEPLSENDIVDLEMYDSLSEGILDYAGVALGPKSADKLTSLRKTYSDYKLLKSGLKDRLQSNASNREFGLTDTIAAAGGVSNFGLPGVVLGGVNKVLRTVGDQVVAKQSSNIAEGLEKIESMGAAKYGISGALAGKELLHKWEQTKDKYVSPEEAAKMWQNDH